MNNMSQGRAKKFESDIKSEFEKRQKIHIDAEELEKSDEILYATFGFHDNESPYSIIVRKLDEVDKPGNDYGLWGAAKNIPLDDVQQFCKDIEKTHKNVYLFLKFTKSTKELKKCSGGALCRKLDEIKDCQDCEIVWDPKKLRNENSCFRYCEIDGKEIDLFSKEIFVKGSDDQDKAFVVEDYYWYELKASYGGFCKCYTQSDGSEIDNTLKPWWLLKRNREGGNKLENMPQKEFAIVLKLKAPYIVKCYN